LFGHEWELTKSCADLAGERSARVTRRHQFSAIKLNLGGFQQGSLSTGEAR
jgi:hypothetical protein